MVVDACYNPSDSSKWCASNQKNTPDPHGCDVHFDIQTGPVNADAPNPVGADGSNWAGKSCLFRRPNLMLIYSSQVLAMLYSIGPSPVRRLRVTNINKVALVVDEIIC